VCTWSGSAPLWIWRRLKSRVVSCCSTSRRSSALTPSFIGGLPPIQNTSNSQDLISLHQALLNNSVFGIVMVPVQTGLALLLAVLVNQKMRGMAVFRTIYFSPIVTPLVVVA